MGGSVKDKITYGFYVLVIVLLSIIAIELHGVIKAVDNIDFVRIDDSSPVQVKIVEGN